MNPELEALVHALDEALQATGEESVQAKTRYLALVTQTAERQGISVEMLERMVRLKYRRWTAAQNTRHTTLPPTA